MASDFLATDLDLCVRKNDASGLYEFGCMYQGAFVVLVMRKTGGIDDDIKRAADEVDAAEKAQAADSGNTSAVA